MLETREQLEELLKNGVSDIEAAAEIADKDPMRPRYHFHSPSQWMDDPNGIIYHKGYYHMMYSLNPNTSKPSLMSKSFWLLSPVTTPENAV